MRKTGWLLAMGSTLAMATVAAAQEATTYKYDPLGRLVNSANSGGPNDGVHTATCFDQAGNRVLYYVGTAAVPACTFVAPAPTPTPTPAP